MEKVLVTGASGVIGIKVIKYLLSEGKYEITAMDLRNKNSQSKLKKYRRRINVIYGDINDTVLMDALVKDQDYIIHLAGVMPPLADIKKDLSDLVEYDGTENIVKAINYYNPNCVLIYGSSTTVYGDKEEVSVKSPILVTDLDYYSQTKVKCEELIKKKLKKYIIVRLPLILSDPKYGAFMYNVKLNRICEALTDNDAGYMLVSLLAKSEEFNKKIVNATGGEAQMATYREILAKVLEIYGLSFKYILTSLFVDKNFYTHKYLDGDSLNDVLEFRSDSLASYYMRLKRNVKNKRLVARFLAKPVIFFLKRGKK